MIRSTLLSKLMATSPVLRFVVPPNPRDQRPQPGWWHRAITPSRTSPAEMDDHVVARDRHRTKTDPLILQPARDRQSNRAFHRITWTRVHDVVGSDFDREPLGQHASLPGVRQWWS